MIFVLYLKYALTTINKLFKVKSTNDNDVNVFVEAKMPYSKRLGEEKDEERRGSIAGEKKGRVERMLAVLLGVQ